MSASSSVAIEIAGEDLVLYGQKVIVHRASQSVVVSDVHIGKAAHFRANAIPIPTIANKENFWKLVEVIERTQPKRIVFLGDLSHSKWNSEWDEFKDFLQQYPNLEKVLVKGNHDILHEIEYSDANIHVCSQWETGDILWTHEPVPESSKYVISGHLHPSVRLVGKAKQSLRLPCFCFGKSQGYLPAFGQFTGSALYQPQADDQIWVISNQNLLKIQV